MELQAAGAAGQPVSAVDCRSNHGGDCVMQDLHILFEPSKQRLECTPTCNQVWTNALGSMPIVFRQESWSVQWKGIWLRVYDLGFKSNFKPRELVCSVLKQAQLSMELKSVAAILPCCERRALH